MADHFPEDEDTTEVTRARHSKTNKMLATLLGLFGILAPIVTEEISYRRAKVEASAEIKSAHAESEAGYVTLSSPLNEVMTILGQQSFEISQLKEEIRSLKNSQSVTSAAAAASPATTTLGSMHLVLHHHHHGAVGSTTVAPPAPSAPTAGEPEPVDSDSGETEISPLLHPLPKSLHDAAEQMKVDDAR
jgi:hypothetical protein